MGQQLADNPLASRRQLHPPYGTRPRSYSIGGTIPFVHSTLNMCDRAPTTIRSISPWHQRVSIPVFAPKRSTHRQFRAIPIVVVEDPLASYPLDYHHCKREADNVVLGTCLNLGSLAGRVDSSNLANCLANVPCTCLEWTAMTTFGLRGILERGGGERRIQH